MTLRTEQFMCRSDNFCVLAHDPESGETAVVDAPEEASIVAAVERTGWKPTLLLTTHHHGDHVEANLALKQRYGLRIVGPAAEAAKIPGIDAMLDEGDVIRLGDQPVQVIATPGHTAGHVSYYLPEAGIAFTGDTLFALGCGRLFEAPPPVMFASLAKLAALPAETVVYCGHEYTQANARFALSVDPENPDLRDRAARIDAMRAKDRPTLPTTIGEELATNPFLRWGDPAIRNVLGMQGADDADVFAEIRKRKDSF